MFYALHLDWVKIVIFFFPVLSRGEAQIIFCFLPRWFTVFSYEACISFTAKRVLLINWFIASQGRRSSLPHLLASNAGLNFLWFFWWVFFPRRFLIVLVPECSRRDFFVLVNFCYKINDRVRLRYNVLVGFSSRRNIIRLQLEKRNYSRFRQFSERFFGKTITRMQQPSM